MIHWVLFMAFLGLGNEWTAVPPVIHESEEVCMIHAERLKWFIVNNEKVEPNRFVIACEPIIVPKGEDT